MEIRHATKHDIFAISEVEAKCFPPSEAASEKAFTQRIENYGNHFWLMYENDKLIAFVDGFVTDEGDLTDEMFADATMHNENGAWQMIFGVNTLPEYRNNGYASELLRRAVDEAKEQGRKGVVLTCKDKLLPFYARLGFVDEGITDKSTHGNAVWHQMRIIF